MVDYTNRYPQHLVEYGMLEGHVRYGAYQASDEAVDEMFEGDPKHRRDELKNLVLEAVGPKIEGALVRWAIKKMGKDFHSYMRTAVEDTLVLATMVREEASIDPLVRKIDPSLLDQGGALKAVDFAFPMKPIKELPTAVKYVWLISAYADLLKIIARTKAGGEDSEAWAHDLEPLIEDQLGEIPPDLLDVKRKRLKNSFVNKTAEYICLEILKRKHRIPLGIHSIRKIVHTKKTARMDLIISRHDKITKTYRDER